MERISRQHPRMFCFIDDITVASKDQKTHIREDLAKTLAICSKYNLLLSPKKVDLCRPDIRVLGYQLSQGAKSLSDEKKKKIKEMEFPRDKKDAVSKAAFFSYFIPVAPLLSQKLAHLRRLGHPKVRFNPQPSDRKDFEALKNYLLDDTVGAIRTMSNDPDALTLIWTDASSTSISGIITQALYPLSSSKLDPSKRYLHIVACWSRRIEDTWSSYPIWILELCALEETTRKYDFYLSGRSFFSITDSTTVRRWSSLDLIPKDLVRRIMRLQKYNFKLLFIETRLNISDFLTRNTTDTKPVCKYERFLQNRIYTPNGENIPWCNLFSEKYAQEANEFFTRKRNQEMAHAIDPAGIVVEDEERARSEAKELGRALEIIPPDGRVENNKITEMIAAYTLNDELVNQGYDEPTDDPELDSDLVANFELERFTGKRLENVKTLQTDDPTIDEIKDIIINNKKVDKTEALAKNKSIQAFLRNRSLFKINKDGILMRLWHGADGKLTALIVVGEDKMKSIIKDTHSGISSPNRHAGKRRTFMCLIKRYYTFGLRKMLDKQLVQCPTCQLNKHKRGMGTKTGNKLALEPNESGEIDVCQISGGLNSKFVYLYVDEFSRFLISKSISSCADDEILAALIETRDKLCGFPRRIQMDNAIAKPGSKSHKFLEEQGVEISHGLPYTSRTQAKVERAISTYMRIYSSLQTDNPTWPFTRLVAESAFVYNSTEMTIGNGAYSPKSVHFAKAPSNFLHHLGDRPADDTPAVKAARAVGELVRWHDVRNHLKRTKRSSPTDFTRLLRPGDLCMKKRTVFPQNSPRKFCYKVNFEIWKTKSRVATNSYRMVNLKTGHEMIIAGDILVKLNHLSDDEALALCDEMERVANREAVLTRSRIGAESNAARRSTRTTNPPTTRQSTARRGRNDPTEIEATDLTTLFDGNQRTADRITRSGRRT